MYGNIYQPFVPYGQPRQEIVKVNGLNGAMAYNMAPNSTAALFDANNDVFYLKSTDGAGFPSYRIFDFTERIDRATPTGGDDRIDQLLRTMDEIKEMLRNGQQSIQPQADALAGTRTEQHDRLATAV